MIYASYILVSIKSHFDLETNQCIMKSQSNLGILMQELDSVIPDIYNSRFDCIVDKSRAVLASSSDMISLLLSAINAKIPEKKYLGLPNLGNTC